MKVKVYFNLHAHKWSIVAMEGPQKGIVIAHAAWVLLENVEFKVSEVGRQRVVNEQRKNVHAFAMGELVTLDGKRTHRGKSVMASDWFYPTYDDEERILELKTENDRVSYNPYYAPAFFRVADKTEFVSETPLAYLSGKEVWISGIA